MTKEQKKYLGLFLLVAILVSLVSMMVIDNSAPLEITVLRNSWFGAVWRAFLFPASPLFILILLFFTFTVCKVPNVSCVGLADGGAIDTYLMGTFSIASGLLYGLIAVFVWNFVDRRRKNTLK